MTKKSKKAANENQTENESEAQQADLTEATQAGSDATASHSDVQADSADQAGAASDSHASDDSSSESSVDDLLDDVRRSLMEAEAEGEEKKPGWWNRIKKGRQKGKGEAATTPETMEEPPVVMPTEPKEDEYVEQIDELIEMLDTNPALRAVEPTVDMEPTSTPPAAPAEPETPVDVEELKKRVFGQRESATEPELSEVRAIALEGGEEVFVEVEAKKEDAAQDRVKAFENSLRPYLRYIYWVTAFVGILMVIAISAVMVRLYQQSRPPEPTKVVSNLPYPTTMALPGGLSFPLGKGAITDGEWNPRGPEWLEGTEICRWVAIPWSVQLEAVVRTLTQKDSIELVMSNNDKLTYNVYSIQELTLTEMQALDQNTPCLLLVLAKQDSEKRWVVTARP